MDFFFKFENVVCHILYEPHQYISVVYGLALTDGNNLEAGQNN